MARRALDGNRRQGEVILLVATCTYAEPLLLDGYEGMKQREASNPVEDQPFLRMAFARVAKHLAQLYQETGRPALAADWRKKLAEYDAQK